MALHSDWGDREGEYSSRSRDRRGVIAKANSLRAIPCGIMETAVGISAAQCRPAGENFAKGYAFVAKVVLRARPQIKKPSGPREWPKKYRF